MSSRQQVSSRVGRMTGAVVVESICTCSLLSVVGSTVCVVMLIVLETQMATNATRGLSSWLTNKIETNLRTVCHSWPRPPSATLMVIFLNSTFELYHQVRIFVIISEINVKFNLSIPCLFLLRPNLEQFFRFRKSVACNNKFIFIDSVWCGVKMELWTVEWV